MKNKKKRFSMLVAAAAVVALIAGVLAYFNQTTELENQLKTKQYGNETEEKFTPKPDWQPGQEVKKETLVRNTGDYDLIVRVSMSEEWKRNGTMFIGHESKNTAFGSATAAEAKQAGATPGLTDGLTAGDESVVSKLKSSADWEFNQADGYWYYTKKLAPTEVTGNVLDSIILAGNTDMGLYEKINYYTTAVSKPAYDQTSTNDAEAGTKWVEFTGTVPEKATFSRAISKLKKDFEGYAGADYTLTIKTETLQATKEAFDATSTWSTTPPAIKTGWNLQ